MNRLPKIFLALSFTLGAAACGGGNSGFLIPADTGLNPYVAPETDELLGGEETGSEEEDYEDYEDEEEEGAETAPTTPAAPAVTE